MTKGRETPSETKVSEVNQLSELISQYPIVGIIDLKKLPASCLQRVKFNLSDKVLIKVSKKTVLKRAIEKEGKKTSLLENLVDQPALLVTKDNPFKIYKLIEKSKSKVSAKPGDVAIDDITVSSGPTDLPPGPAISTLSTAKIPAKVEGGKIAIIRDTSVAKKGDIITTEIASVLNMLKLKPMEVSINVVAMWEDGTLYKQDVLAVDETKVLGDMSLASQQAFNLSIEVGWITSETIEPLILKAFINAKTLGLEAGIIDKGTIDDLLAKAKRQADSLKSLVPETAEPKEEPKPEETKEEPKEEKKEEPKEEAPKEEV